MLGERLRELREERELNQVDIAKLLSVSRSTYGKYETGDSNPDLDKLVFLAGYFDVTIDYLLGKTKLRNPLKQYKETMEFVTDLTKMLSENGHDITNKEEILELIEQVYQIRGILKKATD